MLSVNENTLQAVERRALTPFTTLEIRFSSAAGGTIRWTDAPYDFVKFSDRTIAPIPDLRTRNFIKATNVGYANSGSGVWNAETGGGAQYTRANVPSDWNWPTGDSTYIMALRPGLFNSNEVTRIRAWAVDSEYTPVIITRAGSDSDYVIFDVGDPDLAFGTGVSLSGGISSPSNAPQQNNGRGFISSSGTFPASGNFDIFLGVDSDGNKVDITNNFTGNLYSADGTIRSIQPPRSEGIIDRDIFTFTVADVDFTLKNRFTTESTGVPVTIQVSFLDSDGVSVVSEEVGLYRGEITQVKHYITDEGEPLIDITCTGPLHKLLQITNRTTTQESQQNAHPADTCFNRSYDTENEASIKWGFTQ